MEPGVAAQILAKMGPTGAKIISHTEHDSAAAILATMESSRAVLLLKNRDIETEEILKHVARISKKTADILRAAGSKRRRIA